MLDHSLNLLNRVMCLTAAENSLGLLLLLGHTGPAKRCVLASSQYIKAFGALQTDIEAVNSAVAPDFVACSGYSVNEVVEWLTVAS